MAKRARGRTGYPPRQPTLPTYEKIKPKSEWKYEDDATRLLIHLPGFVKEQIRAIFTRVNNIPFAIKVQGRRHVGGGRWIQFIETYEIPENCDANKISSDFEGGILSIVMPKIVEVKDVYPDKEEGIATPDISSRTSTREKAETSAPKKQREEKDVEAVSPKKEKSQNGQEETSLKTTALVDRAEKIDEKRVGSASESASEKADEKSQKGPDKVSPKTAALADSAEGIDGNKMGSGGESASGKSDGKPQESQGEASSKTASLVDSTEKMDRKMVGSGSESASEKADGKSEKGQDDASTKTTALVDTVEKINEKKMVSGGESEAIEKEMPAESQKPERSSEKSKEFSSALEAVAPNTEEREKIIDKSDKSVSEERKKEITVGKSKDIKGESASASESEAIEKEMPVEAEKPERSTEKSKEFSSALEAVAPNREEKEKIIDESDKSVNEERKKETIVGKSEEIKDECASAASTEVSTEVKHLLLNIGTAVLVIMGFGAYIFH